MKLLRRGRNSASESEQGILGTARGQVEHRPAAGTAMNAVQETATEIVNKDLIYA